jgi:hypothetical protein
MALINRPFPGLFGGVSQQVPMLRDPTQCEIMDNAHATLADGLNKRPGTSYIGGFEFVQSGTSPVAIGGNPYGNVATHIIDQGPGNRFMVVATYGHIRVFNMETGAEGTVSYATYGAGPSTAQQYLYYTQPANANERFRFVTVGDKTWVANTDQAMNIANNGTPNPAHVKRFRVLNVPGVGTDYVVKVNASTVTYTSVAGSTTHSVAQALATAIAAALGGGFTVAVSTLDKDCVGIVDLSTTAVTLTCEDSWANQAIVSLSDPLRSASYLPVNGTGAIYTIDEGNAGAPYYVQYNFSERRYIECAAPAVLPYEPSYSTMPHALVRTGTTTWAFQQENWAVRLVGDETSNPAPSIHAKKPVDIFFFRNRFGILTDDTVVMSRAGDYNNLWSSTARDVLDSDPIDLTVSQDLTWAVPFNDRMILFTREGQWTLSADTILSPRTVSLTETTSYEASTVCRPLLLGNELYFPVEAGPGQPSRLSKYTVSESGEVNFASDLTAHCPNYLQAAPRFLTGSSVVNMLFLANDQNPRISDVYRWEFSGERQIQGAWGKWKWARDSEIVNTATVCGAHFVGSKLYLLIHRRFTIEAATDNGWYYIESLDLNDVNYPQQGEAFSDFTKQRADRKVVTAPQAGVYYPDTVTFPGYDGYTEYVLPFPANELSITWALGALPPGLLTFPNPVLYQGTAAGQLTNAVLRVPGNWTNISRALSFGVNYDFKYRFSPVFMKDGDGMPISASRLRLKRFDIRFENTGFFQVSVTAYKRPTYTVTMNGFTVGVNAVNDLGIATGSLPVTIQSPPEGLAVDITSTFSSPLRIPYAEWTGELVMRSSR